MAQFVTDSNFIAFIASLDTQIKAFNESKDKEKFYQSQKKQVMGLVALEKEFRLTLIKSPQGAKAYKHFINHVLTVKRNLLCGRPFFRERQQVYTLNISENIKNGNEKALYKFNFNWNFVRLIMTEMEWPKNGKLNKLFKEIGDLRNKIAVLNMPLAVSRARIFYASTPKTPQMSYMDMIQSSAEGLMSAIDKFVPPFGKVFRAVIIGRALGNLISVYCLASNTVLNPVGQKPKKIIDFIPGDRILGINNNGDTIETEVLALHDHGTLDGFEVEFDDGYKVTCSIDHKFLTNQGMVSLGDIMERKLEVSCEFDTQAKWVAGSMRGSFQDQKTNGSSSEALSAVSEIDTSAEDTCLKNEFCHEAQKRRMDESLWIKSRFKNAEGLPSKGVSGLSEQKEYSTEESERMDQFMWSGFVSDPSPVNTPSGRVSGLQDGTSGGTSGERTEIDGFSSKEELPGRLDFQLRDNLSQASSDVRSSRGLRGVSKDDLYSVEFSGFDMARGESGGVSDCTKERTSDLCSVEEGQSRRGSSFKEESWFSDQQVAQGSSGRKSDNYKETPCLPEEREDGSVASSERNLDLAIGTDLLRGGEKASRLRIGNDMGGSGRVLSLLPDYSEQREFPESTAVSRSIYKCEMEGRDSEGRSVKEREYNSYPARNGMLSSEGRSHDRRMEELAFKNAPLANSGSLVCRQIIRVSSVGKVRMYDLEVAHLKHNFLLPNGIVTSNSESPSMVHFYPTAQRKIYRANKAIRHLGGVAEADFDKLSGIVNVGLEPVDYTDAAELRELMAASSSISSDTTLTPDGQGETITQLTSRFAGPEDLQPDVINERHDLVKKVGVGILSLSLIEKKLLKMKGINL